MESSGSVDNDEELQNDGSLLIFDEFEENKPNLQKDFRKVQNAMFLPVLPNFGGGVKSDN